MTKDDYKKLKEEIESSGMSIRQYCQEHNLKPNAVYHAFKRIKEEELSLMVIDVPDDRRRFEMSLDGVRIHIEYEDESVLRNAYRKLNDYLVKVFSENRIKQVIVLDQIQKR